MMVTFADGQKPPVLDAIKAAEIPHKKYFKFNNSALFAKGEDDGFDQMFWKMGLKSFDDFFLDFGRVPARSLTLTREVLKERDQLQNAVQALQPQIRAGLSKMEQLRQQAEAVERNKALIEQNKDFHYAIVVPKSQRQSTVPNQYVTNCQGCNYTCHDDCAYSNDSDKVNCCAMSNGYCTVCPGHCYWTRHVNQTFWYELYEETEFRTSKDLKDRFDTATKGKSRAEAMIANMKTELAKVGSAVMSMVSQVHSSLNRLDAIALKPNPLTEVEYIELLIQSEEQQARPGWQGRVKAYHEIKKEAKIMQEVRRNQLKKGKLARESSTPDESMWERVRNWWSS